MFDWLRRQHYWRVKLPWLKRKYDWLAKLPWPRKYDWRIELPDGTGCTGEILYKGRRLPVYSVTLYVSARQHAALTLVIPAAKLEVVTNNLDIDLREVGCDSGSS